MNRIWWCETHRSGYLTERNHCRLNHSSCGWRILIPDQLEADPELVERLHNVVHSWVPEFNWPAVEQMTLELLAAISTPTPVEEL